MNKFKTPSLAIGIWAGGLASWNPLDLQCLACNSNLMVKIYLLQFSFWQPDHYKILHKVWKHSGLDRNEIWLTLLYYETQKEMCILI